MAEPPSKKPKPASLEAKEGSRNVANPHMILLFDVDGTLTAPRIRITGEMKAYMQSVRSRAIVGIVGGSDIDKQAEQLGDNFVREYDFVFPENGLMAFSDGEKIAQTSLKSRYTDDQLKEFVNFCLRYIADLDIPVKRGTFVEFRTGLINVSPVGRNCSQEEREAFNAYDQEHKVREKFVRVLQQKFEHLDLQYSIGGQISFDVFPRGWDKTFCLQYVQQAGFTEIHFFGDKTYPGGNDHEIFEHPATIGHTVTSPDDTKAQIEAVLARMPL